MKSNHKIKDSSTSRRTFSPCWIYLSVALFNPVIAIAQNAIDVGSRKQLFIDHKFIESAEGIRLVLNPPHQTREKLIVADQPWERDGWVASYSTVIQENGKIRMWRYGSRRDPGGIRQAD